MTAVLLALLLVQEPRPNTLVEVALIGTGQRTTLEAILAADSVLLLPARELHLFLGLPEPTTAWVPLPELVRAFPSVTWTWLPRQLRLVVDDRRNVLPASQALHDRLTRQARDAPPITVTRGGPFLALAADDQGRQLVEGGYSYRGRVAAHLRHTSTRGSAWALSWVPSTALFLSYADGDQQPPQVAGRLARGPAWVSAAWTPDRWSADGLVVLGPVALFASTRNSFALTLRGPVDLQIGRTGDVTTGRLSIGPVHPSPFSVPVVPR